MGTAKYTVRAVHGARFLALITLPALPANAAPTDPPEQEDQAPISELLDEEFREDTETREQPTDDRFLTQRVEQVLNNFIDTAGYFRSGYGRSASGGPMVGFQAPGAPSKYRLGNEPDSYAELTISKNYYLPGTFDLDQTRHSDGTLKGPIAHGQVRFNLYNPYSDFGSSDNTSVSLLEAWVSVGHVLPFAPSTKFWAGNRFYRRHDIHVTDFFYWNVSGGGGGIEDVPLGPGHLAFAWIGWGNTSGFSYLPEPDPENRAGFAKSTYDLRVYDLPLLFGHVELGLAYSRISSGLDETGRPGPKSHGFAGALVHTVPGFISDDGVQKFSLQYGTGPARTFTSGFETVTLPQGTFIRPDENEFTRLRVTESFTANMGEYFSLGPLVVFQMDREGSSSTDKLWVSAGARPIVHFTRNLSLAVEGGMDWVKDKAAGTEGTLGKITVAPQVSIGNRWNSRPVIRLFVTGAAWTDDFVGRVGGVDDATDDEGLTAGMQGETWW
jgi:maltoporin